MRHNNATRSSYLVLTTVQQHSNGSQSMNALRKREQWTSPAKSPTQDSTNSSPYHPSSARYSHTHVRIITLDTFSCVVRCSHLFLITNTNNRYHNSLSLCLLYSSSGANGSSSQGYSPTAAAALSTFSTKPTSMNALYTLSSSMSPTSALLPKQSNNNNSNNYGGSSGSVDSTSSNSRCVHIY